jgi:sulfur relay (sulfurtransferase) complex TusBCD TusD component (DsrE family)
VELRIANAVKGGLLTIASNYIKIFNFMFKNDFQMIGILPKFGVVTRVLSFAVSTLPVLGVGSLTLAWDPPVPATGVAGYIVHYGTTSGQHPTATDVGNVTTATIPGLQNGVTYYFVVTDYNAARVESIPSNEVAYTVPVTSTPTVALTSPANGSAYTAPATISLAASVTANGHTITKVQFYNGATLLGEDTSTPYSFTWISVSVGSYSLTARAVYDAGSTVNSTPVSVTVSTLLPTVALTSPANGSAYPAPATINLAASVTANGHTITKVQFYNSAALLGEDASTPYNFTWSSVSAGSYGLKARVVYDTGSTADSAPANVTVSNPSSGLVAAYGFDEGSGSSVTDASMNGNTGTINGATWTSQGKYGGALSFNGSSSYVDLGNPAALQITGSMTWSAWVKAAANPADDGQIVAKSDNASGWQFKTSPDTGPHTFGVGVSGSSNSRTQRYSVATRSLNVWYHVAGVYNAAARTLDVYVNGALDNGTLVGTIPASQLNSTVNVNIGRRTGGFYFNGIIDEVRVYSRSLSQAEIQTDMNTPLNAVPNPLPTVALTSPANGSAYTAPATVNLAASVTANGHTITKVQFYNGATLLGEDTSTPYSFTWSNVSAGSYSLTARAIYDAGSTVNSSPVSVTVASLPAPWQTADIGSVGMAGSATTSSGVYTVKGAGNISGTADNFRFVYQTLSGDGEIKVRLNSVENTSTAARIGVMIRESLTTDAKCAFMGLSPDGTFRWQRRSATAGNTASATSGTGTPPNAWVRIMRVGGTLSGYKSADGVNWTFVNSRSITMAANIYIGLAVASGSSTTLNTSTFANLTVLP